MSFVNFGLVILWQRQKENEKLHRKIIELEKLCDQDKDQAEVKDGKQEKTDEDDEDEDEDQEQDQDEDQEQDPDEVNDDDGNEKMKKIRKKLKETEEELEYAEAHNHKLIAKESELEEARKELISVCISRILNFCACLSLILFF